MTPTMQPFHIRLADVADIAFMRKMLYEAAFWQEDRDRPDMEVALASPELAKILKDWGYRPGDAAVIAISQEGCPLGAAWYRFWNEADHSFGYIREDIPELDIGVLRDARGQGIGSTLLRALLNHAQNQGINSISLSVVKGNPALHLYQKIGFQMAESGAVAWTMILTL